MAAESPILIAACRDVDGERLRSMLPGNELPPVYPGSTAGQCRSCDIAVWIGPKAQEMIAARPGVIVLCFVCAVRTEPDGVVDLGNTFKPKGATS